MHASKLVRSPSLIGRKQSNKGQKNFGKRIDLIGANLRGADLRGADLRGCLLIAADVTKADLRAADLIGADFRDANLSGADLTGSIFLTQEQLNAANGDKKTKLSSSLIRPSHWQEIKGTK
ncbi:pentapeptide repeat-containing protein [Niallia sp. 03133]|uniref:pentapeptide repeat-containing protein n=1 Tax=Niallia sp. 03133 TaxID=3458060 RepID=UPI004043FCA8